MTIPDNPRVAIYLRVSTADQKFRSQADAVRGYCKQKGWRRVRVFEEKASGAKASRTVLDQMLQSARAGELDVIAVYKLDRLGRSIAHLLQILAELQRLRVAFVSTSEGLDTAANDAGTQLQLNMLASVGQFERARIVERVNDGLKAARRRGVILGRPRTTYGPQQKVIELRTKKLKPGEQPMSYKAIGAAAGVSEATAYRICQRHFEWTGKPEIKTPPGPRPKANGANGRKAPTADALIGDPVTKEMARRLGITIPAAAERLAAMRRKARGIAPRPLSKTSPRKTALSRPGGAARQKE